MTKHLKTTTTLFLILFTFFSSAQIQQEWSSEMSSNIIWQEVTSLGNVIVCSGDMLAGLNTSDGSVAWSKPNLGRIDRAAYSELPGSPFFTIDKGDEILLIDQFGGDELFNSKQAGIKVIKDYFLLYNHELILVAGNDLYDEPTMVAVNMSDGSVAWKITEKFGKIITAVELDNQELLMVTLFNNYKLNSATGDIIWKEVNSAEAAEVDKMGAFGALMKNAAENMAQDMEFNMQFHMEDGSDIFYLGSEKEATSGMTSSAGNAVAMVSVYNAYSINDGSLIWDEPLEVRGSLSHLIFRPDGMLILPDDGNRTKINLFDPSTQNGKWGKKGKGVAIKGGIYDYIETENGVLLVTHTTSNDFLNYLDPATGTITFDKPVKVSGSVVGIVPLDKGILFITTESMNILDPTSGSLKWGKGINTSPNLTAEKDGKIYAFDYKSRTIKVVDLASEGIRDLGPSIKFEGGESPSSVEIMEDGVFLHSDQNVAKVGFDGKLLFQQYYAAPKESGWKRALLYAEAVRGAYVSASSYYVSGAMASVENDVRQEDAVAGEMVGAIGDAYGELGNQASAYAANAFKQANSRYNATQSGRDFMFIMSKKDKSIKLLKVSKSTGEIEGEIDLGKDREPIYAVDDITGQVYYCEDNNVITSYTAQ